MASFRAPLSPTPDQVVIGCLPLSSCHLHVQVWVVCEHSVAAACHHVPRSKAPTHQHTTIQKPLDVGGGHAPTHTGKCGTVYRATRALLGAHWVFWLPPKGTKRMMWLKWLRGHVGWEGCGALWVCHNEVCATRYVSTATAPEHNNTTTPDIPRKVETGLTCAVGTVMGKSGPRCASR